MRQAYGNRTWTETRCRSGRDPVGWLKAKRKGIVLLKPQQAYSYLDHLPGVIAEDVQHGEELEKLLWTPRRKVPVFLRDEIERRAA